VTITPTLFDFDRCKMRITKTLAQSKNPINGITLLPLIAVLNFYQSCFFAFKDIVVFKERIIYYKLELV
jgi:hypothetical protein